MGRNRKKKVAVVQCTGSCRRVGNIPDPGQYEDCRQAVLAHPEGLMPCRWGCIGLGSCVQACRLDAIYISELGAAETDWDRCVGCGLCVKACPQGLIRITAPEFPIYPACINEDAGAQARKYCDSGCIACGICVKNCPVGAIQIENGHAVIDEEKCIACGMCAVKCPRGVIRDHDGIFTVREERVVR